MSELTRFGVSLDKDLLEKFDELIKNQRYETRSKAISDLIKEYVETDIIDTDGTVAGAVTFLYSHHNKELVSRLLEIQHDSHHIIISMQHIHLDKEICLEILAVRGEGHQVKSLYHQIKALKGVKLATVNAAEIDNG